VREVKDVKENRMSALLKEGRNERGKKGKGKE
jgi:hypothetical protein